MMSICREYIHTYIHGAAVLPEEGKEEKKLQSNCLMFFGFPLTASSHLSHIETGSACDSM